MLATGFLNSLSASMALALGRSRGSWLSRRLSRLWKQVLKAGSSLMRPFRRLAYASPSAAMLLSLSDRFLVCQLYGEAILPGVGGGRRGGEGGGQGAGNGERLQAAVPQVGVCLAFCGKAIYLLDGHYEL